jgi:tRNA threonylcarbamoyladenosine biosynthesis protein TsaB
MNEHCLTLAIETASRVGAVAIGRGDRLLAQQTFSAPLRHSTELLPTVKTLLEAINAQPTDIGDIIISIGPGSFTGLRIAVATAKGMALSNGTRIIAVNTLDIIAANALGQITEPVSAMAAILDAKRNQFFIAGYDAPAPITECRDQSSHDRCPPKILSDCLLSPSEFQDRFVRPHETVALLGDGLLYHKEQFTAEGVTFLPESTWSPKAEILYQLGIRKAGLGEFSDPLTLTPFYLRAPLVTPKGQ